MKGDGEWVERIRLALADRPADSIPETECEIRAAVTLILRPPSAAGATPEALLVRRAVVPMAIRGPATSRCPAAAVDPEDEDLLDTARREILEETGLRLEREDHLGRLGEIHPRSRHLPSICVTPFVAWMAADQEVRVNHELTDHVWIPVSALSDPTYRSTLVREAPSVREFPAVDYEGNVIWGLTFAILEDFLAVLATFPV